MQFDIAESIPVKRDEPYLIIKRPWRPQIGNNNKFTLWIINEKDWVFSSSCLSIALVPIFIFILSPAGAVGPGTGDIATLPVRLSVRPV